MVGEGLIFLFVSVFISLLPVSCLKQLHPSVSPFCFLLFPTSETQGAGQTQTETQEDDGHVALPRPTKHHGPRQG